MTSEALARSEHQNVYFDPGLRRLDLHKGKRGKVEDIVASLPLCLKRMATLRADC